MYNGLKQSRRHGINSSMTQAKTKIVSGRQALASKERIRGGVDKNLSNFLKLKSKPVYLS